MANSTTKICTASTCSCTDDGDPHGTSVCHCDDHISNCDWSELNCGSFNQCLLICTEHNTCNNITLFCESDGCIINIQCNTSNSCGSFLVDNEYRPKVNCRGYCDTISISYISQNSSSSFDDWTQSISTASRTLLSLQALNGSLTILDNNHDIGWIKAAECRHDAPCFLDSSTPFADFNDFVHFSRYAISFRLSPTTSDNISLSDYVVETAICSNPIYNLNHGKELSFTTNISTGLISGFVDVEHDWIGTLAAKNRLINTCYGNTGGIGYPPNNLSHYIYNSCGEGIQIKIGSACSWAQTNNTVNLNIYIGFDANLSNICVKDGNGDYVYNKSTFMIVDAPTNSTMSLMNTTFVDDIQPTSRTHGAFSLSFTFFLSIALMILLCVGCLVVIKNIIKYLLRDVSEAFVVKEAATTHTAINMMNVNEPVSLTTEEQKYPDS